MGASFCGDETRTLKNQAKPAGRVHLVIKKSHANTDASFKNSRRSFAESDDYPMEVKDALATYVGPIASYLPKPRQRIWEETLEHELFTEKCFLKMENQSSQVDWIDDKYALQQTSIAVAEEDGGEESKAN